MSSHRLVTILVLLGLAIPHGAQQHPALERGLAAAAERPKNGFMGRLCGREHYLFRIEDDLKVLKIKYLRAWISYEGILRDEIWPMPMPAHMGLRPDATAATGHR